MRRVAMGDPQAPFEKIRGILARHGLLRPDGRLAPDVFLVSIGDHFDWGGPADREDAAHDGLKLLNWLSSHPPEQVVLLAGNHDLSRVGELLPFSDAQWQAIRAEADAVRDGLAPESEFLRRHPELPTAQVAWRDFAAFQSGQRVLVERLLRDGRYCIAWAPRPDLLLTHAGVTIDDLAAIAAPAGMDATGIAAALNHAFDAAIRNWDGRTPFGIPGLYRPGSADYGEARGMLYHRPANPEVDPDPSRFGGPPRRRFDPRRLVPGLMQAIGHIRDAKCRELLGPWTDGEPAIDGPLRTLTVRGGSVRYGRGVAPLKTGDDAALIFLDGGMLHAEVERYELLDLDRMAPLRTT